MIALMTSAPSKKPSTAPRLSRRLQEALHLQRIEGNPLTAEECAMFAMFERENWSPERRRAHILARFKPAVSAAE